MSMKLQNEYWEKISDGTTSVDFNTHAVTGITTLTVTGFTNSGAITHTGTTAGFFSATPTTKPTAYTQTYATADKTHANPTATSVVVTGVTNSSPYGFVGATQGDALSTTLNAVIVDLADLKQLVNSVIDDLQALGLVG